MSPSLEEKVRLLEELCEKQRAINREKQLRIERLWAALAVRNVIAKFEYYCEGGHWTKVPKLFAQKQPDVRSEIINWGVYEGVEGIMNLYGRIHKLDTCGPDSDEMNPGFFEVDIGTTSVIEVAGDCKTARMLFISPGAIPVGWHWMKLGVDFIKEDDEWKIWHYHVYSLFVADSRSWADQPDEMPFIEKIAPAERLDHPEICDEMTPALTEDLRPNRPTTHPTWWYRPNVTVDPVPAPPLPYQTWDTNNEY